MFFKYKDVIDVVISYSLLASSVKQSKSPALKMNEGIKMVHPYDESGHIITLY